MMVAETTESLPPAAPISRQILRQAGPMTIGELAGVVAPIIMVSMLGRAVGDHALIVRSLYWPLELVYIAIQFAYGTSSQVGAAISFGAGRKNEVGTQAVGLAVLWAAMATIMAVALWVAAPYLADVLNVGPGAREDFMALVRWSGICHPALAIPVLTAASLRGAGHPKAGTAVSTTGAVLELGIVAVFGVGGGLGANAIPVAFALGGAISGALGLFLMRRAGMWPGADLELRKHVRQALRRLTSVGLPVGLSYGILSVSNFVLMAMLGPLGPIVQAGYANALTLQTFVTVPGVVLGSATAIMMNRQRGAGRESELGNTFLSGLRICAMVYLPLVAAMWLGRDWLAALSTTDPGIQAETARFLAIVGPTYVFLGLSLVTLTAIEQTGMGVLATALNLIYFTTITALGGWLARSEHSSTGLYWTVAVLNSIALLIDIYIALLIRHRARKAATPT